MHEIGAMLRAQWMSAISYRLRLLFSLSSLLVVVVPVYYVSRALQPMVGDALVGEGGQLFAFLVVGTIALVFIAAALATLPQAIGSGISTGIWEAMLATPARVWALVVGMNAYELLWSLAKGIALLFAAWLLGARVAWSGAALALLIMALIVVAYLSVGLIAGAMVLAFRTRTPLPQAVLVASVFLGGVYYPTAAIPGWLHSLSSWIPLTYGLRALRRVLLEGWTFMQILPDLEMLLLFDTVLLLAGSVAFGAALRYARRAGTLAQY